MTAPTYDHVAPAYAGAAPGRGAAARAVGATPRALVLALAAFLAINFARAHELVPQIAVLRLGKLIGFPLVILAVQRLPRRQMRDAMRTAPGRGILFIGLMMVLSVPLSIWPGNSIGYIRGGGLISYIMFITTASVLVDRAALPTILNVEVLAVGADALRMLLPGAPLWPEGDGVFRVAFGYTYDPNDSAALFLISVPIALYLGGRSNAGPKRLLWYGSALLMIVAMVRTGSRGGLLGLGAMLLALVLLAPPKQRARLMGAGVAAALAFAVAVNSEPALKGRFLSTFSSSSREQDYNYTSTNGRVEIWKRGIHYMVTHPVTGVGINNFAIAEYQIGTELKRDQGITDGHMLTAHNSYVQIGAELGVPGLAAYLFVVFSAGAALWRVRQRGIAAARSGRRVGDEESALASAAITALTGLCVGGFFLSLAYSPMTLFTFALCSAIIAGAPFALQPPAASAAVVTAAGKRPRGRRGGLWRGAAAQAVTSPQLR